MMGQVSRKQESRIARTLAAWLWLVALVTGGGACGSGELAPADQARGGALAADAVEPAAPTERGAGAEDAEAPYRAFADRIAAQLQAAGVPGGALGIVQDGKLVFATGLGVKRAGSEDAVGTDTVFRIASTTKTMVAAMVMSLAEEGAVSLDAPGHPATCPSCACCPLSIPSRLTLRRLLSHTAGVPDYLELECAEGPGALAAWFEAHPNLVLWSPPGRLWSYSNLGFSLAGLVAERAAGADFRALVEGRILAPLGMETATFDVDEVLARNDHAVAHPQLPFDPTLTRCALTEPPGYMYASVNDLGKLTEAMLAWGGDILQPRSVIQMALPHASTQAPPDMFYGLGLLELPYRGQLIVGHPGDLPGLHSAWWMVPQARFGVIMLVNGDTYPPTAAAIQAIDAFVGGDDVPPPDWSTPPSDWARYVGFYDGRVPEGGFPPFGLGVVEVELEGESLSLTTLEDGLVYPLVQGARDTFSIMFEGTPVLELTFWRDRSGQAEYLATRAGHARRIAAPPPAAPAVRIRGTGENPITRLARQPTLGPTLPLRLH